MYSNVAPKTAADLSFRRPPAPRAGIPGYARAAFRDRNSPDGGQIVKLLKKEKHCCDRATD